MNLFSFSLSKYFFCFETFFSHPFFVFTELSNYMVHFLLNDYSTFLKVTRTKSKNVSKFTQIIYIDFIPIEEKFPNSFLQLINRVY